MQFCSGEAVQILGGAGFIRGTRAERVYREAKVFTIGGGAEEIMNDLAAKTAWMVNALTRRPPKPKLRHVFENAVPFNKVVGTEGRVRRPGGAQAALRHAPRAHRQRTAADPARRRDLGRARCRGRLRHSPRGDAQKIGGAEGRTSSATSAPSTCTSTTCGRGAASYFIATGRVVRLGNRVAVAQMELVNDSAELIATGNAAYMISSV